MRSCSAPGVPKEARMARVFRPDGKPLAGARVYSTDPRDRSLVCTMELSMGGKEVVNY